jgi:hypothetical protein
VIVTVYYTAGCNHPPTARNGDFLLKSEICGDLELLIIHVLTAKSTVNVTAGDFNAFDTALLEANFGLDQLVEIPTHRTAVVFWTNSINCSDTYHADTFASLVKSKHQVVYLTLNWGIKHIKIKDGHTKFEA